MTLAQRIVPWLTVAALVACSACAPPAGAVAPVAASGVAPGLEIAADMPGESTGTMHYAEQVTVRSGTGSPLVLGRSTRAEGVPVPAFGDLVPIPGPHYALGKDSYLLLGWSSIRADLQTIHALRLRAQGGELVLTGHLQVQTDRPNAGLVVRPGAGDTVELGFPEPEVFVHFQEEWFMAVGVQRIDLDDMRRMVYADYAPEGGDRFYSPPVDRQLAGGRVAWIAATPGGFRLPFERLRAPAPEAAGRGAKGAP